MNKKLLLISFIACYSVTNVISAQSEQDILEKYKDDFAIRTLSTTNRKAVNGVNDTGEKVVIITYDQVQTNKNTVDNLKELVLTSTNNTITDVTFNYGSEVFFDGEDYTKHPRWLKGVSLFVLRSKNILNENFETVFIQSNYEVIATNSYDKEVFDIHLEADLNISAAVWKNLDLITKKYNEAYETRSIEELFDLGLYLTTSEYGYEETNLVLLKMILKEREAIINHILRDYNSNIKIEIHKFLANPEQLWDQYYIDPIKYINIICNNSPLLK